MNESNKQLLKDNLPVVVVVMFVVVFLLQMPRPTYSVIEPQEVTWQTTGVYVQILIVMLLTAIYAELALEGTDGDD